MRQYCSGGSRTWSSIQPLSGRLQQRVVEEEAGTGRRAAGRGPTSAMAASTSRMCSNTRQATTASNAPAANGRRVGAGAGVGRAAGPLARPPRSGSTSGRRRRPASAPTRRGQPGHLALAAADVEHPARRRPARSAASGRICSSYSGSAPSVNPSLPPARRASSQSRRHAPARSDAVRVDRAGCTAPWSLA